MRPAYEINILRFEDFWPNEGPSVDAIQTIEALIGKAMPAAYLDVLRYKNGGSPGLGNVVPLDDRLKPTCEIDKLFFLSSDTMSSYSVIKEYRDHKAYLPRNCLPFGMDGGGSVYFMNFDDDPPSIWLSMADENGEPYRIANSFEAFVDSLLSDDDLPSVNPNYVKDANGRTILNPAIFGKFDDEFTDGR